MELGAFSVSLAVKNLQNSKEFYEKLGFEKTGGDGDYLIMSNGDIIIGLFQNIIDSNILTFNPGLNNQKEVLENFTDIRQIRNDLLKQDIELGCEPNSNPVFVPKLAVKVEYCGLRWS